MSRSKKKMPIRGNCSGSDKESKRTAHQKDRKKVKKALKEAKEGNEDADIFIEGVHDVEYDGKKDGKHYFGKLKDKDPKAYDKNMRK